MRLKVVGTNFEIDVTAIIRLYRIYGRSTPQRLMIDTFPTIDAAVEWVKQAQKEGKDVKV